MLPLIGFALAALAVMFGYTTARQFVRRRLRYVTGIDGMKAPVVAGLAAFALAAIPWLIGLPPFGPITAALIGVSVGAGVRAGVKDIGSGNVYIEGP